MNEPLLAGDFPEPLFAEKYPLKILVVDDHDTNRRLLLHMLKSLGYEAEARVNGRECFEAVLAKPYDLLLSDIDMPEMSGIECTLALRRAGFDVPIVAVTSTTPEGTQYECFEAGMSGYLRKPVGLAELKQSLREVALRSYLNHSNAKVLSQHA